MYKVNRWCSTYYQHETGTDQVKGGTVTAILANITSGDFDITQRTARGQTIGMPELRGDGEFINEDKKIYTRLYYLKQVIHKLH